MTASLFVGLVFVPSWVALGLRQAQGVTLGLLCGYLTYSLLHHAVHHGPVRAGWSGWLRERRRWHARHHSRGQSGCHGVSTSLWDHLLGTARPLRVRDRPLRPRGSRVRGLDGAQLPRAGPREAASAAWSAADD